MTAVKTTNELKDEANILFRQCRYGDAVNLYDECLRSPNVDENIRMNLFNNKAQCFLKLDRPRDALDASLAALEICNTDAKALYRCSQAYDKLEKWKESLEAARKLIQLQPKNKTAQNHIYNLEAKIKAHITENNSLSGRINKMFTTIREEDSSENLIKGLRNLSVLVKESSNVACSLIWNHDDFFRVFSLCNRFHCEITPACHQLIAHLTEHNPSWGLTVLQKLSPQYFVKLVYSANNVLSMEGCRFLTSILESLTQLKAYHKSKDAYESNKDTECCKVAEVKYPRYKMDELVAESVTLIIQQLFRFVNNSRLAAKTRDFILEILVRFVPSEKGIGISRDVVKWEGAIDNLLEVACASGTTSLKNWRTHRTPKQQENTDNEVTESKKNSYTGVLIATTSHARMNVACLMAKLYEDLTSDKLREGFVKLCDDFVLDLLADHLLETKVDAASLIGTLFLGPFEVGSTIISRQGVLEGLLMLTTCENQLYQAVALDAILLAINKKQHCISLVQKAVPVLKSLYKSEHDGIRIRALVALCKIGAAGGSDISFRNLTEGSHQLLLNGCRRLLLGVGPANPDVDQIHAVKLDKAEVTADGEILLDLSDDDDSDTDENHKIQPTKYNSSEIPEFNIITSDRESLKWAIEGLAYLSMNAEIKEEIVNEKHLVSALFQIAQNGEKECALPLSHVLTNLTNSEERQEIDPELRKLAEFAKQHIPEQHKFDSPEFATKRRIKLLESGLPAALYHLTTRTAAALVGSDSNLAELLSRLYLTSAELVQHRGSLIQNGAAKALLKIATNYNTDAGKLLASQALARLIITNNPRSAFPGQKSLDVVKPLLQLLNEQCTPIQIYEGLLALTNLASLDDVHRHRIMVERGLALIDAYLFDEDEGLRRAAVECVANMAHSPGYVMSCGGTLPLDDADLAKKLTRVITSTERVKLLVLYCGEFDDLQLVRAASGALASMSYDPGIITKITNTSVWFEVFQTLAGHPSTALQHRAAHILSNFVLCGDRSLSEYICRSNMLEVIMALSQFPELTMTDEISPDDKSMNSNHPEKFIREQAIKDRKNTINCAMRALKQLKQYGLVKNVLTKE